MDLDLLDCFGSNKTLSYNERNAVFEFAYSSDSVEAPHNELPDLNVHCLPYSL